MAKQSRCPGCKQTFLNGRPHSIHMASCEDIRSATDMVLKKHKIYTAKKYQAKKVDLAARKDFLVQAAENQGTLSSQDDQDHVMDANAMNEVPPCPVLTVATT